MPQMRHEPAKGGRAYQRAACAMCSAGTPGTGAAGATPPGAPADEVVGCEPLVEDHAGHRVEERDVRARPLLDPEVGLVTELDALGVDDDQPRAPADGAPEADRDDRMVR